MPEEDTQDPQDALDPTDAVAAAEAEAEEQTDATAQTVDETDDQAAQDAADDEQGDEQENEEEDDDDLPPFEFEVEDSGTLKKTVTITVPQERIDVKRNELYGELGTTAQVPGFRIGRAPRRLIEKRFGKEVGQDVRNALVGEALGYVSDKADFRTIGEPDLELDEIKLPDTGEMTFSFEIEVSPDFDVPELKGINVEKVVLDITDERVSEYVDRMRQQQPKFEESSEGPAAQRDIVITDTKVTVEGIEKPVESTGTPIRVSVGQVEGLPLLELGKELTGKTVGDTVSLTVDVPQAHPNEEWRGKKATVEITVTRLRRRIVPEIDDEYAKSMGFDSMAELRDYVREQMQTQVVSETQQAMRNQIGQYLLDNTDFELPPAMAARHSDQTLQRRAVDLMTQGVPRDRIEEHMTELQAAVATESARSLKLQFIVGKIAQAEEIGADEGEVNARVAQIAARNNRRPERVRQELEQDGSLRQIEGQIIEEKVFDKLLVDATVTEISREEAEARRAAAEAETAEQAAAEAPAEEAPDVDEQDDTSAEEDTTKD